LDHNDCGIFKKTPGGEVVAMIKTMLILDAQGIYKVDWSNRAKMFLDNVGTGHTNNTAKSIAFKELMVTHLGDRIQRKNAYTYFAAKNTQWFQNSRSFLKNTSKRPSACFYLHLAAVQMPQCKYQMPRSANTRCRAARSADAAVQMPQCRCRSADADADADAAV
jgi:hypothetical protein